MVHPMAPVMLWGARSGLVGIQMLFRHRRGVQSIIITVVAGSLPVVVLHQVPYPALP
jgi:hypothetical protein